MSDREPIIQAADGEVKPDPPIEIYPSKLHGYWMVRWGLHEYATPYRTTLPGWMPQAYLKYLTGEKVKVVE